MRGYWGRYEICDHEAGDNDCDGGTIHWALVEVDYENVAGQFGTVRIVRPDIGMVDAIDVRPTLEEARRRLSDNLRFLACDLEKQMREAEYASKRVLESTLEAAKLV